MINRYKYWWVFGILSGIVTLLNPRVGILAIISGMELFSLAICYIIFITFYKRVNEFKEINGSHNQSITLQLAGIGVKIAKVMFFIFAMIYFIGKIIPALFMTVLNDHTRFLPFFEVDNITIVLICLIIAFLLNLVQLYYSFRFILAKKLI